MGEKLKTFDDNRLEISVADRNEVHKKGHWHETFHCWLIDKNEGIDYIYFQKRSHNKKDFPNLFDITAAGHILSNENVEDGVREVKEELGLDVHIEELRSLGVIEDSIITTNFIDRELANVFLYEKKDTDIFTIQREEVSGIVRAEFNNFYDLCLGKTAEIVVKGFEVTELGEKITINKTVRLEDFVPHEKEYLEKMVRLITNYMKSSN